LSKDEIRRRIWGLLEERGVASFPLPVFGRIPNFVGAREAAVRLSQTELWRGAKVLKVNPDSPQAPVRELALREGKRVVVPTPRLRGGFLLLEPGAARGKYRFASTIRGAFALGKPVRPEDLPRIDLVVVGSVAVNRFGDRIGKSEGYSEIEWAIAREEGKVREDTAVVTTIHDLQLVEGEFETAPYDLPVDSIVTPTTVLRTEGRREKPRGIYWELMPRKKIDEIPLLRERLARIARGERAVSA